MKNIWVISSQWNEEWDNFDPNYLIFVTDENVLLDNIENRMKESNFNTDLATEMLEQIGVKSK